MKLFKPRPGVVLLEVCGEAILVATGEARGKCNSVTHLNPQGAKIWKLVMEQIPPGEILNRAPEVLGLSPGEAMHATIIYFAKLQKSGLLLEEEVP